MHCGVVKCSVVQCSVLWCGAPDLGLRTGARGVAKYGVGVVHCTMVIQVSWDDLLMW